MNPNDSSQNASTNVNQVNNAGPEPFFTPTPVGYSAPSNTAAPAAQSTPVQAAPATPVTETVAQTPVTQTAVQTPVAPAPEAQTVAPAPVAPTVQSAPVQAPVSPTPMPATPAPVQATPMPASTEVPSAVNTEITKEDPNAKIAEVNIPPSVPASPGNEPVVITPKKSKGSNIVLVLVIAVLIAFVYKIDYFIELYENYMETGSLTPKKTPTDNLSNGYILIGEKNSYMRIKNIKFYNFKKDGDMKLSFNYEAFEKYNDSASLEIYIEIYNSSKEILYKELFDTGKVIEKNTTVNYSMNLESDVYEGAYYALVKVYSEEEKNATSSLTCKYQDNMYIIENKYNFKNNGLVSYDVSKESISEENIELENEYNSLKDLFTVNYEGNKLTYSVDLNTELLDYNPIYKKGTAPITLKNREELKKWNCE